MRMGQVRSSTGSGGARGHCRVLWRWKKWKSKKRMSVTERSCGPMWKGMRGCVGSSGMAKTGRFWLWG